MEKKTARVIRMQIVVSRTIRRIFSSEIEVVGDDYDLNGGGKKRQLSYDERRDYKTETKTE